MIKLNKMVLQKYVTPVYYYNVVVNRDHRNFILRILFGFYELIQ